MESGLDFLFFFFAFLFVFLPNTPMQERNVSCQKTFLVFEDT